MVFMTMLDDFLVDAMNIRWKAGRFVLTTTRDHGRPDAIGYAGKLEVDDRLLRKKRS